MPNSERRRPRLLLLLLLGPLLLFGAPAASDAEPIRCSCPEGEACYHFLEAPVSPPDDPCHCPGCRAAVGSCPKVLPKGWDPICASNGRMECFLRRHGASWGFACSERLAGTCDCRNARPGSCPRCGERGEPWGTAELEVVRRQVETERRLLGDPRRFVVVLSPHFYLVTNIRMLKIRTQAGSFRMMGMHELAHVYAQRAEIAYEEFVREIGEPTLPRPMGMYLLEERRTQEDVQDAYFGNPRLEILYGGGFERISGGLPYNGFAESLADVRDDESLHLKVRHSIGHILMSCWPKVKPYPPELPHWLYAAAGHWLARRHPRLAEMATFCGAESEPIRNNGKHWAKRVRRIAAGDDVPIQKVFDAAWEDLDLDAHVRVWSWFEVFLAEDRARFVEFLRRVRGGEDHRNAMKAAFGCPPEEFDARWRDRVLGRRPTVAASPAELDAADPERPGAAERAGIRGETDPDTLAARIASLRKVDDPLTAATVAAVLGSPSPNVRETAVIVLSRSTEPAVKEWLRTEGLSSSRGLARAGVARVVGNVGDPEAGEALAGIAGDGFWLVRAHAARALGLLRHEPAKELLKEMVGDGAPKVRIAAMDALGRFGERAASAWEVVAEHLGAAAWPERSAAAACLAALGDMRAVEPLIARMEIESGRIRKDIRDALKAITKDDLGNDPHHWREWWEREKERHGGAVPPRPEPAKPPPAGEHEYGETPTYYGLQVFSEGVGYVLDVSSSMLARIRIDPEWLRRNRREYPAEARKFDLARNEIEASLRSLDRRVRFDLYFFRRDAFRFEGELVPADAGNVDAAVRRMAAEEPKEPAAPKAGRGRVASDRHQTNYVDAFRLVLDVKEEDEHSGRFGATPDTVYFLTDGRPTTGDITDGEVLLSWFRELNRFARMKVNVIAFGRHGVDDEFLRRLAEENDGTFVLVPETR